MTPQQRENVKSLIALLMTDVPDESFDISYFWDPRIECGCALGHAHRIFPELQIGDQGELIHLPTGKTGYEAGREVLGLPVADMAQVFSGDYYGRWDKRKVTPQTVASRLNTFLEDYDAARNRG